MNSIGYLTLIKKSLKFIDIQNYQEIDDCSAFYPLNNGKVIISPLGSSKDYIYDLEKREKLIDLEGYRFYVDEIMVITYDKENFKIYKYNLNNNTYSSSILINVYPFFGVWFNNSIIAMSLKDNDVIKKINGTSGEEIWSTKIDFEKPSYFRAIDPLFYHTNRRDTIYCRNINDGSLNWAFSVAEIGKFNHIGEEREGMVGSDIYLYQNLLITYVLSSKIIALNQETGQLKWVTNLDGTFAADDFAPDGFIYCLESYYENEEILNIYEIEALTGKISKKKDIFPNIKQITGSDKKGNRGPVTVTDKHLYFSLPDDMMIFRVLRETFEIDWHYKHHCPISGGSKIEIVNNYLLFKDTEHQIFIFKGEPYEN